MERLRSILHSAAGPLVLATALALSLPGVQIARAGSDPASGDAEFDRFMHYVGERPAARPRSAGHCRAGESVGRVAVEAQEVMERLQRRAAAARAEEGPEGSGIRVLNSRGYNYGAQAGPAVDLGQIQKEMRRRAAPRPRS